MRILPAAGAALTLLALPAGAQTPPRGYATEPYTPPGFALPDGEGCAGDVARWQAVGANDYASGNVSPKVYAQIQAETGRADAACRAGQDAQARKLVAESKRRHGYPQGD